MTATHAAMNTTHSVAMTTLSAVYMRDDDTPSALNSRPIMNTKRVMLRVTHIARHVITTQTGSPVDEPVSTTTPPHATYSRVGERGTVSTTQVAPVGDRCTLPRPSTAHRDSE
jgi:hypothetical protein